jgi:hypothetical protein
MIIINQGETLKIEKTITNLENLMGAVAFLAKTDNEGVTLLFECTIVGLVITSELGISDTQDTGNFTLEMKVWLNGEADTIMLDYLTINKSYIPLNPSA